MKITDTFAPEASEEKFVYSIELDPKTLNRAHRRGLARFLDHARAKELRRLCQRIPVLDPRRLVCPRCRLPFVTLRAGKALLRCQCKVARPCGETPRQSRESDTLNLAPA